MFQAPTRLSIWAVFSLSLLAGIGVQTWRRPVERGLYWTRLGTMGAFAISLGAGLAYFSLGDIQATFIRATALAGLWALGAGTLALLAPPNDDVEKTFPWWPGLVVLWVATDLVITSWGLVPGVDHSFYTAPVAAPVSGDTGRVYLSADQEYEIKYERFLVFESFQQELDWMDMRLALLPNLNMLEGIPSVNNFDPLVPGRYATWMESLGEVDEAKRETLLRSMGVSTVETVTAAGEMGIRFNPLEGGPRLRWVPCARFVEGEAEAWEQVFLQSFDPEVEVILEGGDHAQRPDCISGQGQVNLDIKYPNKLLMNLDANTSGWVVISDTWYPGWKAWVDGNQVPIWRANYLHRAISVEAGNHQILLEYHPVELILGKVISMAAILIVSVLYRSKIIDTSQFVLY